MALCAERGAPGLAELSFAGPVPAETARRLACDASVSRILTGPNSLPLDVGREQRTAPAGIRRAIEARDPHCVFTGCIAPPAWCDVSLPGFGGRLGVDHGVGGRGSVAEGGFRVARDPGTVRWRTYRPDGTEIVIRGPAP
jgi:hypothetical protein